MPTTQKDLESKREQHAARMKELHLAAEKEKRSLSEAEKREWNLLKDAIDTIDEQLPSNALPVQTRKIKPAQFDDGEARCLRSDESFRDYIETVGLVDSEQEKLSLRKTLRGLATGDWSGASAESRALAAGSGSGAFTIPTVLSANVFDRARELSTVMRAGAKVLPIEHNTDLATVVTDPVMGWRAEAEAVAEDDIVFGSVQLRPKSVACLVTASVEFLQDSVGGEDLIINVLSQAIASELDRAALMGTGTNDQPMGIANHAAVSEIEVGAGNGLAPVNYSPLSQAIFLLAEHNCSMANVYSLMSPKCAAAFDGLQDGANNPMQMPFSYLNQIYMAQSKGQNMPPWGRQLMSSKIPNNLTVGSSTDCSTAFLGDFSSGLTIGMRLQPTVQVLRERKMDTLQVQFVVHARMDVACVYPKHLVRVTGLRV